MCARIWGDASRLQLVLGVLHGTRTGTRVRSCRALQPSTTSSRPREQTRCNTEENIMTHDHDRVLRKQAKSSASSHKSSCSPAITCALTRTRSEGPPPRAFKHQWTPGWAATGSHSARMSRSASHQPQLATCGLQSCVAPLIHPVRAGRFAISPEHRSVATHPPVRINTSRQWRCAKGKTGTTSRVRTATSQISRIVRNTRVTRCASQAGGRSADDECCPAPHPLQAGLW
jgi:hypothetical protein